MLETNPWKSQSRKVILGVKKNGIAVAALVETGQRELVEWGLCWPPPN